MTSLRNVQQRLRGTIRSALRTSGRKPKPYYSQQSSCQIPSLSHLFSLFFGDREGGTFVEIGAYDGVFVSNTWGLAERNWHGFMVEPIPALAEKCRSNHRRHPLVSVTQCAIGNADDSELRMFLAGTLTTASEPQKKEYESLDWAAGVLTKKELVVPSRTLNTFLKESEVPAGFELLVVDVEGFEAHVFSGFSLGSWKPQMMIVELVDTHPDLGTTKADDARLGRDLATAGYTIVFKDPINTVFVRDDVWKSTFGF